MEPNKIWAEQCEATRGIEAEFGTDRALDYLVGEKFLNFLELSDTDRDFRAEIPSFVAEIRSIFEPWQIAEYLASARETEPFDPSIYDGEGADVIEMERRADIRRCAADLLLVERAREWLLEDEAP